MNRDVVPTVSNANLSSAFFGNLDEPDLKMGMAEMHGSNSIPLGLDDDLNLEESAGKLRHVGSHKRNQTHHLEMGLSRQRRQRSTSPRSKD